MRGMPKLESPQSLAWQNCYANSRYSLYYVCMVPLLKKTIRKIYLMYWTIRYLSFHQVVWRSRRWLRHHLSISSGKCLLEPIQGINEEFKPLYCGLHDTVNCKKLNTKIEHATRRATGYKIKRFTFLNHEHTFDGSIDWNTYDVSQLWRYHLHYFDIVQDLLLVSVSGHQEFSWHIFKELADSWIDSNSFGTGDGWHP